MIACILKKKSEFNKVFPSPIYSTETLIRGCILKKAVIFSYSPKILIIDFAKLTFIIISAIKEIIYKKVKTRDGQTSHQLLL